MNKLSLYYQRGAQTNMSDHKVAHIAVAYIASGFFTPQQNVDVDIIKGACREEGLLVYSPRDEFVAKADDSAETRRAVFTSNCSAINSADLVVVNTRDKDVGSIFEAGYASARQKPIIYFWAEAVSGSGKGFNLMLAESGIDVTHDSHSLRQAIRRWLADPLGYVGSGYQGRIE